MRPSPLMRRLSARTTWYVYEGATSFLGLLAFTVTAVYYVTGVGMSPLQLVLVGTLMEVAIFVFEIPTGIVADIYSRRLSIVVGTFVMGVAVTLWRAHSIRDVGLPDLGGLDLVVWFGVFGAGTILLSIRVAAPLGRRIEAAGLETMAKALFWLDASLLVSALAFGLAGEFWLALIAFFAVGLARNVAAPIFQAWLNRNVEESGVRATALSITSQADAVGQWTGGPAIGLIGSAFSIRAALSAGALCMAPALALYRRAARHHGEVAALESLPPGDPG